MGCAKSAICERLLIATLLLAAAGCERVEPVVQPFDFNHKRHKEADVDCLTCHEQAADGPAATLPPLRVCAKCHKELQGKDPKAEQAVMEAVKSKQPIAWVQVNRLPGHVYFSHRAHVGFAEMTCDTCHGDMTQLDHSLASPNIGHLTMTKCMSCHKAKSANLDCIACHK